MTRNFTRIGPLIGACRITAVSAPRPDGHLPLDFAAEAWTIIHRPIARLAWGPTMGSATHNTPTRRRGIRWAARAGIGTALLSAGILAATPWDAPRRQKPPTRRPIEPQQSGPNLESHRRSQSPDFRCWPCRARWTAAQILRSSPSRTTVSTSPGRLRRAPPRATRSIGKSSTGSFASTTGSTTNGIGSANITRN